MNRRLRYLCSFKAVIASGSLIMALALSGCSRGPADLDLVMALDDLLTVPIAPAGRPAAVSDMISTYDRTGGNKDWGDWREMWISGDDYLLADLRGPGCLRRIWMTNVRAEEWLFFFDNERRPRLQLTADELFAAEADAVSGFGPPLADQISGGAFCYLPMPYQTRLRIVARNPYRGADARPYFHINYETYPAGTRVTTFPRRFSSREKDALARVRTRWTDQASVMTAFADGLDWTPFSVSPGESVMLFEAPEGPGMIATLGLRFEPSADINAVDRARALRHLVLVAHWDGAAEPSVEVPVGDFFCNGLHARRFTSLTLANVDGRYISRFPMPFASGARLTLRNDGPFPVSVTAGVETAARPDNARYFHAAWHSALNPGAPFRIMRTEGRGVFLGTYLIALGMEEGWNILEGDEFFFRDGNWNPVHHGTGLEDYFNGGWYYYGLFEQPLHGLTEKAAMRTAQYRLQIPDPVTFERSLDARIEFGDGNRSRGYKSAASYWYQDRPGPAGSVIPVGEQRFPPLDQVGVAAIMSELFELERMGLDREAEERSAYYAALFAGEPLGAIYRLRELAYREIREGPDAVRAAYREIAGDPESHPDVARQAELLGWRIEAPYRALFGGQAYSTFRLYVNGQRIGEGGDPFTYQAFPVELSPGSHLLQAEIRSQGDHAFYTLGFFSDFTNVVSDVSWDYAIEQPAGWPEGTGDESLWKPYATTPWFFPNMQWWRFAPNAFPAMQSGQQVGGPIAGWEQPAGRVIYLRRRIRVPEDPDVRSQPFPRRTALRTVPVRPAGDTSNMQYDGY